MSDISGRRWHDMGGDQAGPCSPWKGNDFAFGKKRVMRLMVLCSPKGILLFDGFAPRTWKTGEDCVRKTQLLLNAGIGRHLSQNPDRDGVYTLRNLAIRMEEVADGEHLCEGCPWLNMLRVAARMPPGHVPRPCLSTLQNPA